MSTNPMSTNAMSNHPMSNSPTPSAAVINNATPRRVHIWQCPECDNRIILHVRVQHAPICHNKAAHSRRRIDMQRQRKGTPQ
ncbi:MAG: hypothetical protein ACKOJG_09250 [Actinomycetota bacterium]